MKAYFDASALVSVIVSDTGWAKLVAFLDDELTETVYSDLGWGELVSALGNRVRRGDISAAYAKDIILKGRIYLTRWTLVRTLSADIDDATDMLSTFTLALKLPDAIHIATAKRLGIPLVSTDLQQVRAAAAIGVAAINPLQ